MKGNNYQRGSNFERRIRNLYLAQGCPFVERSAGSHGVADLVAVWPAPGGIWSRVELISCRTAVRKRTLWTAKEKQALIEKAAAIGGAAVFVGRVGRGKCAILGGA